MTEYGNSRRTGSGSSITRRQTLQSPLPLRHRNLLDELGLDEDEIINAKMTQNEAKYPVEKARGSAAKYDQLAEDKKTEE